MWSVAVGEHLSPPMEAYFFPETEFLQIVEGGGRSVHVDLRRAVALAKQGRLPDANGTSLCAPLGRLLAGKSSPPKKSPKKKSPPK